MPSIAEVRQQYPQYSDMSDDQLADALHQKYYSDMPKAEFRAKVGLGNGATGAWGRGATGSYPDPRLYGLSELDKYRLGGKVSFGEQALGVKQLFGNATPEQVDAYRQQNAGVMEDPTVQAGNTSGYVATSLPAMLAPGANTVLGSALLGGAYGAAQAAGTGESKVDHAVKGAVTSGGVTAGLKMLGRVAQPVVNSLTDEAKKAVDLLRRNGVRLSVGQQTGSRAVQATERMLGNNPYTGPSMGAQAEKSQRTLTRAFLRTAGVDADAATPAVLGAAETRIGGEMNAINGRHSLDINSKLTDLADIADEAQRILPDGGKRIVAQVDHITNKAAATGQLDAKAAQKIRTELGTLTRDPVVGEYAYKLRNVLDNALEEATHGTSDAGRVQKLRSQYRNLKSIADATDTTANAQVSGPRLAQVLKSGKYTKGSMRTGRGDTELSDLARAASTVADRFPNSGTAAHAAAQLVAPSIMGAVDYAREKDPTRALEVAGATFLAPKAAAGLLNNPATANYLARGVPLPPVTNQLAQYALRIAPPLATSVVARQ